MAAPEVSTDLACGRNVGRSLVMMPALVMEELGWRPTIDAREGVTRLLRWVQANPGLFR